MTRHGKLDGLLNLIVLHKRGGLYSHTGKLTRFRWRGQDRWTCASSAHCLRGQWPSTSSRSMIIQESPRQTRAPPTRRTGASPSAAAPGRAVPERAEPQLHEGHLLRALLHVADGQLSVAQATASCAVQGAADELVQRPLRAQSATRVRQAQRSCTRVRSASP